MRCIKIKQQVGFKKKKRKRVAKEAKIIQVKPQTTVLLSFFLFETSKENLNTDLYLLEVFFLVHTVII